LFSITSAVTFIIVLGVLVGIHEFGHYIVARMCGIQVETFSLGFGPKIFSKKIGPTEYCISVIPLGGYVRMLGDDPNEEIPEEERARSFLSQPVRKKIAVVIAGPAFNLLLAFVIFWGVFMVGLPVLSPVVGEIQEDSAAKQAGLQTEDRVLSIEGKAITEWEEIRSTLQEKGGGTLNFVIERSGDQLELEITPKKKESTNVFGDPVTLWLIGILPEGEQFTRRYNPATALYLGAERTIDMTVLNVVGITKMIQGKISSDNIGGPILIAQIAGQQASQGFLNIVLFVAVLSINSNSYP